MAEEPLFNIHLNVDYPFNLTGILYFPKIKNDFEISKNKIQLYSRQVFITDEVKDIVPEFLMMLHGVIDSPDIPLNVSRSYLQADGAVKKISSYISRKVADKLNSLFKNSREDFENANGYSNEYWGYGFHDLDLLYRLERSGAYLEKFYDLNNVYSNYDELDILPYRIEKVSPSAEKRIQQIHCNKFGKSDYIYGTLNSLSQKMLTDSFSISFWFNDDTTRQPKKNLFVFEGCDSGLFLSNGNELIAQIWDINNNHNEVILSYSRNRWNHCVYSYDATDKTLRLSINNKTKEIKLKEDFEIYDYRKHCIKISDDKTSLSISNILAFDLCISSDIITLLYNKGNSSLDDIESKYGIIPSINLNYDSTYKNTLILDSGKFKNHLKIYGKLSNNTITYTPNEIYLPIRFDSEYKSLVHKGDSNIIKKYYDYNPDITENADIFFHDVVTNSLDYKQIGLNTLKYSILDIQNKKNYELIRIVT